MRNWRKPPDFRGLFPDQPGFADELLKNHLRFEQGLPLTKHPHSATQNEKSAKKLNPYEPARLELNQTLKKYLETNGLISSPYNEIQSSLERLGLIFYSRREYFGFRTLFSRWTAETIETDLLESKSFIEPVFKVHSPEKYAAAHREARNEIRHLSKYILNQLSRNSLELLTGIGALDPAIKKATGLAIETLIPIDLCINNALTGKPFPNPEHDEGYLIAQSYLLDFIRCWKCRPNIEKIMVAMDPAQKQIASVIDNEPVPERVLFFLATKAAHK
ncbi:hypothetical protein MCEMIE11_00702 [Burkholderiales bacterium]